MPTTNPDYGIFQREQAGWQDAKPMLFTTISSALLSCTAGNGDKIVVSHDYTETRTAVLTITIAGVSIIGVKQGNLQPILTVNGAVDCVSLDAANVTLDGFDFAIVTTNSATSAVNVTAAKCAIRNIKVIGSVGSTSFVDCITLASGANDCLIENVQMFNTVQACNSFLSIEAAVARLVVKNFFAFGVLTTAGIIDAATATQILLQNVTIGTVGTTIAAAILDSNPTGMAIDCNFAGTSTTLANNANMGTGLRLFNVKVLEETDGSKQGALIPAVDVD